MCFDRSGTCPASPSHTPIVERAQKDRKQALGLEKEKKGDDKILEEFARTNGVQKIWERHTPPPVKPPDFNDDLRIEHYASNTLVLFGMQRKGIYTSFPDAQTAQEHIDKALEMEFELSSETPLQRDVEKALEVISNTKKKDMEEFWDDQLKKVKTLVQDSLKKQNDWNKRTPKAIRKVTKELKTVAIWNLLDQYDMGGDRWIHQFTFWFPITGVLSQEGVFPRSDIDQELENTMSMFSDIEDRFRKRAKTRPGEFTIPLWKEAIEQVDTGWLDQPIPLREDGRLGKSQIWDVNLAFIFGAQQEDELRACDDLRDSRTNDA